MDVLDLSRWQFGITTVYHFILVPLTIGLAPMIAIMQTMWVVTKKDHWYRLTKFFGKLFLINFALGVATGIVQEFQFGMNWSEYSRFVGDVFGAPLALEGLVAFFLESTFLGLWIFGWTRLPKLLHLATIWLVAIGVNASAFFIISANSFMQHPVGAIYNPETGRAELTSIWTLLTNNTALAAFPHAVAGAFLTAGTFVAGIAGWWMVRNMRRAKDSDDAVEADRLEGDARGIFRPAARLGMLVMMISGVAVILTGDVQAKLMFEQQPMKMASAESLCHTEVDPNFSVLTIGTHNDCDGVTHLIEVPFVLSYLAEGDFSGVELQGVQDLQEQYEDQFGPGNYRPNLFVTYWSFRAMIGLGAGSLALALAGLWVTRGGRVPDQKWFGWLSVLAIPTPFLANSAGWIFTEMGRQPWVVHPNPTGVDMIRLTVDQGVSDNAGATVITSLVAFTLVYAALGVVWFWLIRRYTIEGPLPHDAHPPGEHDEPDDGRPKQLSFAY
ncbi:cytochrome ubiquinol oxidase subunit I [Rhodococcus sp. NPDC003382]|uniref:cytochrome ubiquinol oxidase subunit I n=1 Tax=unclassified Rhodococcus (in: high G+C Gram-positive bacteria) TaxID=192944 RepID=UPI0018CE9557|nr:MULTISPECIES: cytochrome ubiquinol oxidase subunit I [unclassified Rhodococcus (in: high G+C Gram-positive bacteria)]MBH0121322.1 cytochrome ubiquinol oxidase subunit I [Rhodococcus sp. CX]MCK8670696.1 cytochrome ubiquinol oxidase subunit I [Rhodococcus sp. HM1]